jgi:geranylgeranyl diphosphate synthase type I
LVRYSSNSDEPEKSKAVQEPGPRGLPPNPLLARYRLEVDKRLSEIYSSDSWISAAANEAIRAGGKRLRPLIAVLTCEAICGNPEPAFPVGMAYELAHAASLIQDDIIDESAVRHASPTAYKRYGLARAIMLSDSMIFEIFALMARYRDTELPKAGLAQLLELLGRSASLAAEGEMLEVALSRRGNIKTEEYTKVIGQKTGALFAAAAASGAVVARADKELVDKMYEFGISLGVAFQIGDDILDLRGNTLSTGKPVFKDIENNAGNVVLLHALSNADVLQKNAINSLLFKKWFTSLEAEKLLGLLNELGSFEYAYSLLGQQTALCRTLLNSLPASYARNALEELTRSVEVRKE